jgi:ATP/ADP translocase
MNGLLLTVCLILAIWYLARELRAELASVLQYVALGIGFIMAFLVMPAMILVVMWMTWVTSTSTMPFGTMLGRVLADYWIFLVISLLAWLAILIWPNLGVSEASSERPWPVPRIVRRFGGGAE